MQNKEDKHPHTPVNTATYTCIQMCVHCTDRGKHASSLLLVACVVSGGGAGSLFLLLNHHHQHCLFHVLLLLFTGAASAGFIFFFTFYIWKLGFRSALCVSVCLVNVVGAEEGRRNWATFKNGTSKRKKVR